MADLLPQTTMTMDLYRNHHTRSGAKVEASGSNGIREG